MIKEEVRTNKFTFFIAATKKEKFFLQRKWSWTNVIDRGCETLLIFLLNAFPFSLHMTMQPANFEQLRNLFIHRHKTENTSRRENFFAWLKFICKMPLRDRRRVAKRFPEDFIVKQWRHLRANSPEVNYWCENGQQTRRSIDFHPWTSHMNHPRAWTIFH